MQFSPPEICKQHAILQVIYHGIFNKNLLVCLDINLRTFIFMKTTLSTSWCVEWLLIMLMLCLNSSSHMAYDSTSKPTSSALIERVVSERPNVRKKTLYHATQGRDHCLDCQKFSPTTSLLTFVRLTVSRGLAKHRQNSVLCQRIKDKNNDSISEFKTGPSERLAGDSVAVSKP